MQRQRINFEEKLANLKNARAIDLLNIVINKKSNIVFAADIIYLEKILELLNNIGDQICMVKLHADILVDFNAKLIKDLISLAKEKAFLIMEDRKFADIGNTVKKQYTGGVYEISTWSDFITMHSMPGASSIHAICDGFAEKPNKSEKFGIFLIASMSPSDSIINSDYLEKTVSMMQENANVVSGLVAQPSIYPNYLNYSDFLVMTPGVGMHSISDKYSQNYKDPAQAIQNGSDLLVVGRDIYNSLDYKTAAANMRNIAWKAYDNVLNNNAL